MKIQWHQQVFSGIALATCFILVGFLYGSQGRHTVQLFGGDYGLERIKSSTFLVLGGDTFRFPFDTLTFFGAVIGLGIAVTATWTHFKSRSSLRDSNNQ